MSQEWRNHPKLRGRLHPEHPDDVQVLVHDGGPRMTTAQPEAVWVRIIASEGDVFQGEVLNQPQQLAMVKQGDRIQFVVPNSGEFPLLVRPKYLAERAAWVIHPCNKCGLSELFDARSDQESLPESQVRRATRDVHGLLWHVRRRARRRTGRWPK